MDVVAHLPSAEAVAALLSGLPTGVNGLVGDDARSVVLTLPPDAMARTLGPGHPYRLLADAVTRLGGTVHDHPS